MNNFLNGKSAAMMLALSLVNVTAAFAQDDNSSAKEEGNRNVMLNAASANGPREIQIGLPSADVNVLENGLPVTYATNPHSVNTIWRGDASLSHQGLLKIAETAIHRKDIEIMQRLFARIRLCRELFHPEGTERIQWYAEL